jgi:hypothetical protein
MCLSSVLYTPYTMWRLQRPAIAKIKSLGSELGGAPWSPAYVTLPAGITDTQLYSLVEALQSLRSLHKVTISGAEITANGLKCLKPVSRFAMLDLTGTEITPEGISEIRQTLPDVVVIEPVSDSR